MATFTGTPGADTFEGTGPATDVFRFLPANLTSGDIVTGGFGSAIDTLRLLGAGTVSAGQLAGVSGIERVIMFANSSIDLTSDILATAFNTTLRITGGAGNDDIFGGGITDADHRLLFTAGTGRDTFIGGVGSDEVSIRANAITNRDILLGGDGADTLVFTSAGTVTSKAISNVFSFENIVLHRGGNNITLSESMIGSAFGAVVGVKGNAGDDSVTTNSSFALGGVTFNAGGGDNKLVGGGGADITTALAGNDDFQGNGGDDQLRAGRGNDTLTGGAGQDFLDGEGGNDILVGGFGDNTVSGGSGADDINCAAQGANRIIGGAGSDTITVFTNDTDQRDTLVYNAVSDGGALGDTVLGDLGTVADGDIAFAFNDAAFNTLGNNFNLVNFDNGTDGAGSDGADLVLFNDGTGAGLGSGAAVDQYFADNYVFVDDVGAFFADFNNTDNTVTIYYDPDAFNLGAVHVLATIDTMTPETHALLGDNFSFL